MTNLNVIDSFGFLYSRRCPAQCKHCGTSSNPFYREKLSMVIIEKLLKSLPHYTLDTIGISGGEPLLYYDDMLQIGDIAQKYNIELIIFSNAFWAYSDANAKKYLLALKDKGLDSLRLSTDQFHQEFIALENIVRASKMASELGIPCTVMIPSPAFGWSTIQTLSYLEDHSDAELITHPIHPIGRALELDDAYFQWKELELKGCDLVGKIEVDVTGLVAQCPPASDFDESNPLILGDLNTVSIDKAMDSYQYSLLFWILGQHGPLGLYNLFVNRGIEVSIQLDGKISNCQLCQQLTDNQEYFEEFYRLEKIDLQSTQYMKREYQERCSEIIII